MDNELRTWSHLGLFDTPLRAQDIARFARLAPATDTSRSLEDRARSYLDANCSGCHRPGGTVANFDARYDTPLEKQGLIDGPVLLDQGIDRPRIISPHDVWRSIAFMRVNTVGDIHMPPLDRTTIDQRGVDLLRQWIDSLPGPPVLAPPQILPAGGTFGGPVQITLSESEPGADIRYTLDGSVPGRSDLALRQAVHALRGHRSCEPGRSSRASPRASRRRRCSRSASDARAGGRPGRAAAGRDDG